MLANSTVPDVFRSDALARRQPRPERTSDPEKAAEMRDL
ncbi:hypothetical protein BN971_01196 [Mycobacterium bohemicum DSM 44277]|uniref:Uncharacterized protein n=1 Tax=Mycobacterium bohemicum DSM 44277 TaxID=1236609 RepID=A0A0U0W4Z8_MYCBE|nr:hypothetical protein BN971_01196 [Mycobacterium bohemicum DSM 44277]